MRYIIYGAGAVGGTIGGRLFEHGHDVTLIARGDHVRALAQRGLTLRSPDREVQLDIPTVDHPGKIDFRPDDVVVLAMKSQDTDDSLEALSAVAPPTITIVTAQNGVANEAMALRRFPHVVAMCVMLPAEHLEPGIVAAYSAPLAGILDVGLYPVGRDGVVERIAHDLQTSGFDSRPDERIMRAKYAKLLMNLGNALEAACGSQARGSGLYRELREEGVACFAAAGIDAASVEEDRARRGDILQMQPVDGRSRDGGSSWQSLARGTGVIETDYLNGEIVLLGRLHGVPTPINEVVQRAANRMARDHLPPGSLTTEELLNS